MSKHTLLSEPEYVNEPQQVQDYGGLASRVGTMQHPVIVRRGMLDVTAVLPMQHLGLRQELRVQQEAEQCSARVDWTQMAPVSPPQQWFEGDTSRPF
jgi:hypothetical protein